MKIFISMFVGMLLSWNACALEVEGVKLPDTIQVGERDLVLNGAGVRSKFGVNLYVAALYLTEKKESSAAIFSANRENRLALHILHDISAETLLQMFNTAVNLNLSPSEVAALDSQLKKFSALFTMMREATEDDVLTLDYLPGKGTEVSFNDVTIGTVEGAAFNIALLKVWLGNKPVQEDLKVKLLGGHKADDVQPVASH